MSQILPNLWLSGADDATNLFFLTKNKISNIIACAEEHPPKFPDKFTYLYIKAKDNREFPLDTYFDEAADFINNAIMNQKANVLVHCYFGVSRSATLVIAYLIKYHSMTCWKAKGFVQNIRHQVSPNDGFWVQLQAYFHKLNPDYLKKPPPVVLNRKPSAVNNVIPSVSDKVPSPTKPAGTKSQDKIEYNSGTRVFTKSLSANEEQKEEVKPYKDGKSFSCKRCKQPVFTDEIIKKHNTNSDKCNFVFLDKVPWMKVTIPDSEIIVYCPNKMCPALLGRILANGVTCSCGVCVKQAVNAISVHNVTSQ
jgi:atypical dual specificity phosphatase